MRQDCEACQGVVAASRSRGVRPQKFQFLEKGQNRNFDYKIVNFV